MDSIKYYLGRALQLIGLATISTVVLMVSGREANISSLVLLLHIRISNRGAWEPRYSGFMIVILQFQLISTYSPYSNYAAYGMQILNWTHFYPDPAMVYTPLCRTISYNKNSPFGEVCTNRSCNKGNVAFHNFIVSQYLQAEFVAERQMLVCRIVCQIIK